MRKVSLALPAIAAILALWLHSNNADRAVSRTEVTLPSEASSPIPVTQTSEGPTKEAGGLSETASRGPEAPRAITEVRIRTPEAKVETAYLAAAREKVVAECQPSKEIVDFEAFRCGLALEDVDPNWGPLVETLVSAAISTNEANLLSLTVECKTTICEAQVRQAETPLLEGAGEIESGWFPHPENDPRTKFYKWLSGVAKSLHESGLEYSRIDQTYPELEEGVFHWRIWITRVPYH